MASWVTYLTLILGRNDYGVNSKVKIFNCRFQR